jgi:phosphomannomutase
MEKVIRFGTDGWRSRMNTDFHASNVARVAKAIADHLKGSNNSDRGVFVGYDGRKGSRNFARICAEVLASGGIKSMLPTRPVPTPVSAFAAVKYSLNGAIMITASHNPAAYNGIKFIPSYGGPATTDITTSIEGLISDDSPAKEDYQTSLANGMITEHDPLEDYIEHLKSLLIVKELDLRVAVDPMHGATSGILDVILEGMCAGIGILRGKMDPLFGGIVPDPVPANLIELRESVMEDKYGVGLALDGDGDRLAAVTAEGTFLMANQILPILYTHLLEKRGMSGDVARTVATSHLVDKVAEDHSMRVIETPVGFKYIGELLREKSIIIGGEESGGISFAPHIPEKDGIASALLLLESIVQSGSTLQDMIDEIHKKYGALFSARLDLKHFTALDSLNAIESRITPKMLGGKIEAINRNDGLKLLLEGGSWLLFRLSGTENVVRVYAESRTKEETGKLLEVGKEAVVGTTTF